MKRYNSFWIGLFSMFLLLVSNGCKKDLNETVKQSTYFSGLIIKGVEIDGPFEVLVIQDSTKNYMVLEYSAFAEEKLDISINNLGIANVSLKNLNSINKVVLRATIYANSLEEIDLSSAATMTTLGNFYSYQTEIETDEASTLSDLNITTNFCTVDVSGASTVTGNIHAIDDLILFVSESSEFTNGFAVTDYAKIIVESASEVNMIDTEVRIMNINLSESSIARVFVTEELTYKLVEASQLYYKGSPTLHQIELTDGSSIYHLP